MFWNGQKIVDLSRAFLDTSGCAKKQDAKILIYKKLTQILLSLMKRISTKF
jgi:phosphoribosylformylglycinamidine synthase